MQNIQELFEKKVNAQIAGAQPDTILFYKGFTADQVRFLMCHPRSILNAPELLQEEGLDLQTLDGKWMDILVNLKMNPGPWVGFYEELLALRDFLPKLSGIRIQVVENNLLSPWTPCLLPQAQALEFFDYQQQDHEPDTPLLKILTRYYGEVKILDEGQSLLLPVSVEQEESLSFWDGQDLQAAPEDARALEYGSREDWAWRLQILRGRGEPARLLYHGKEASFPELACALSELQIPCSFCASDRTENRMEYDGDQFLPLLQKYWGAQARFRPLLFYKNPDRNSETETISQGEIIAEIIDQCEAAADQEPFSNIFITAPTGAGKSLLFQLPALYLAEKYNAVTIVVSPLIALMNDQVDQLERQRGISIAACLNSGMTIEQRLDTVEQVRMGQKSLLYLAPELLLSTNLQSFLGGRKVGLVVIDEAHTVTSWGRDFRSDYWFLGDFLRKTKRDGMVYPVLCLTATAVYSGEDDVVNDTINELGLERTIIHLGNVRRKNIVFDICRHDPSEVTGKLEAAKADLTLKRMRAYIGAGEKVLTYFPYRSLVDSVYMGLASNENGKLRRYHGQLPHEERKLVERDYKSGEAMGLLCTKAFGMGIDVSDIRHVIHFAPTGTLSDYVQEIGRSARDAEITGTAHIDFFPSDLHYVQVLNGISEMRQYQLREMLKKLCSIYETKKRRNLLISAETFEYLFPENDVENRTKSGLMLLARDLSNKFSFPVLVVRPKAMLSKNYVHVPGELEQDFLKKYGACAKLQSGSSRRTVLSRDYSRASDTLIYSTGNTYLVDMAEIWEKFYPDRSFGLFKKEFFDHVTKVRGESYRYSPRVKAEIHYKKDFDTVLSQVERVINAFVDLFSYYKNREVKQFTLPEFEKDLSEKLGEKLVSHDKMSILLDIFTETVNENAAFSQARTQVRVLRKRKQARKDESVYFVSNGAYVRLASYFMRYLNQCAPTEENNIFSRFYPMIKDKSIELMPVLRMMELLDLATYEIRGGEKAEVFIRINDPLKLQRLAAGKYKNTVLQAIQEKHRHNQQLLNAFFTAEMPDDDRWELIEQYFLGNEQYVDEVLHLSE